MPTHYRLLSLTTVLLLSVFSLFLVTPSPLHAAACTNAYTKDIPVPTGYGAAYNLFSTGKEVLLQGADCTTTATQIQVGSNAANQYIYNKGYSWNGTSWQAFTLTSTSPLQSNTWYTGQATASVTPTNATAYVAYICQQVSGAWKCGCRDEACSTPAWQLQKVTTGSSGGGGDGGGSNGQCRQAWQWPCAAESPWNTPIGSNAQYSSGSDAQVTSLMKHNRATLNTTAWSMSIVKGNETLTINPGGTYPQYVNFTTFQLKGPAGFRPTSGTDANVNFVQPDDATNIELYGVKYLDDTTLEASMKMTNNIRQSCVGDGVRDFIGTRAYGGSSIGGLIRDWEVQGDNQIRHVLALAVCWDQLKNGYVWPATCQDGGCTGTQPNYTGQIPMGTLFAIPQSVNIDSLGLNEYGKKLAHAAQKYGALIVDQGCGPAFYAEPGLTASIATAIRRDTLKVLQQLAVVTNNTKTTPGGGGTPGSPLAPPICAP